MARILVIDDEPLIRLLLERALKSAGHEVILAADGGEGLKKHNESPADLAVIDLFMPGKEGLETIIELRAKSPQTPILAISGGYATSAPMLAVAKKVGADNVLHKPFEIETLLNAIEKHLGQKKS